MYIMGGYFVYFCSINVNIYIVANHISQILCSSDVDSDMFQPCCTKYNNNNNV